MNHLLILLNIYFVCNILKYSDWPVLTLPRAFGECFLKPKYYSEITLNIAIGFVVSSLFYLIVVYIPERDRRLKVQKIVLSELAAICYDIIFLVFSMYKSTCFEKEWQWTSEEDDELVFSEKYYQSMELFDTYSEADSAYRKKVDGKLVVISWEDKLSGTLDEVVSNLDNILSKYIFLIDNELLESIMKLKNNEFLKMYLGLPTDKLVYVSKDFSGERHAERFPLNKARKEAPYKHGLLFSKSNGIDNIELWKSFINDFLQVRKWCVNHRIIEKNIGIKFFYLLSYGKFKSSN